jgi:hypothetical protein
MLQCRNSFTLEAKVSNARGITVYFCRAPLRDNRCVVHEVLDFEQNSRACGRDDLNRDLLEGILEEGARLLPRVEGHMAAARARAGAGGLMTLTTDQFAIA